MPQTKVKVLRPEEGSEPKIRISNAKAMAIREKYRSSTMGSYLTRTKESALADPVPKPRLDHRGAANREANRASVVAAVLNPSGSTYHEPPAVHRGSGPQTEANRAKGEGRLRLFGSDGPSHIPEPAVPNRCPAGNASENMERSRSGVMSTVMVHSRTYTDPPRAFRGQGAAVENCERANGSVMAATMNHSSGGIREAPPAARCPTAAAQEAAAKNRGCMERLIAGQVPGDPCPRPRLGIGAGPNAQREGDGMMRTLAGSGPREPPPAPRVTAAGATNAAKNNGSLTQLQYNSRAAPEPEEIRGRNRPGPGASNAKSAQGTATRMLFARYGNLPADPKAQSRVQPRGRKIARLSSGSQTRDLLCPPKPRRHRRPKSCHN